MQSGTCVNCGAAYGPNDKVCSYCGTPIDGQKKSYSGLDEKTFQQVSNGAQINTGTQVNSGTQVNIYVTNNNAQGSQVGAALDGIIGGAVNRVSEAAKTYAERPASQSPYSRSRSRLLAGILAIIFGWIGVQFFYLNKIGLGIVCVIFCYTGIPALIGVIHGVLILKMSDADFEEKYHVRAI